jgi:hypothetical protein
LNAVAIASAPKAATVTLTARPSYAFRDRIGADKRFSKAIMRPVPEGLQMKPSIDDIEHGRCPRAWLLPNIRRRLETWNQPAYPVR